MTTVEYVGIAIAIVVVIAIVLWQCVKYLFNKLIKRLTIMDKLLEFVKETRLLIQELNGFVTSGNLDAIKEVIDDIQGDGSGTA